MPTFNPMQLIVNQLQQRMGGNPMVGNVIQMAQKNDVQGLEQFARNLGKEKGVDVDELYKQAMQKLGMQ